jgi:two-component system, OmpR family, KDP operon response regulator KdpE
MGVPIIVLSVRETEGNKVAALDAGADDYVTKPFGMAELLARLRPRCGAPRRGPWRRRWLRPTTSRIDLAAKQATVDGAEVRLTPLEWQIVEQLVRNEGRLMSQRQLLLEVWGPQHTSDTGGRRRRNACRRS